MYEILSIHLHIHSSYSTLATLGIMKLAFLYTRKAGTDDRSLVPQHIGHMTIIGVTYISLALMQPGQALLHWAFELSSTLTKYIAENSREITSTAGRNARKKEPPSCAREVARGISPCKRHNLCINTCTAE